MDLQTVEEKLKAYQYANDKDFDDDLMLIWSNAKTFNGPLTEVYQMADKLEQECLGLIEMPADKILQKKDSA